MYNGISYIAHLYPSLVSLPKAFWWGDQSGRVTAGARRERRESQPGQRNDCIEENFAFSNELPMRKRQPRFQ